MFYYADALELYVSENEPKLLKDQQLGYNINFDSVRLRKRGLFFLDAPSATGITYLMKLLLAKVRKMKGIALAVAFSGIAATFLPGDRTSHFSCKLPI